MIKYIIVISVAFLLVGCSCKEQEKLVVYKTIYKTKKVKVPIKCDIPKPTCDFKSDGYTPAIKLLECVITQKKYITACNENNATSD